MKRWIWVVVLLIPLYIGADGLASSFVFGTVPATPAELVLTNAPNEPRIPIWLQLTVTETQPEGSARRISAASFPFGFRQTYEVPGGARVRCRHLPFGNYCSGDWSYVFTN